MTQQNEPKQPPWVATWRAVRQRCNDKNSIGYKNYGGRGIKCLISKEDLKKIWLRDKAHLLKRASIEEEII